MSLLGCFLSVCAWWWAFANCFCQIRIKNNNKHKKRKKNSDRLFCLIQTQFASKGVAIISQVFTFTVNVCAAIPDDLTFTLKCSDSGIYFCLVELLEGWVMLLPPSQTYEGGSSGGDTLGVDNTGRLASHGCRNTTSQWVLLDNHFKKAQSLEILGLLHSHDVNWILFKPSLTQRM